MIQHNKATGTKLNILKITVEGAQRKLTKISIRRLKLQKIHV
jgi:hypothetical protein